jgi:hypothetical protein
MLSVAAAVDGVGIVPCLKWDEPEKQHGERRLELMGLSAALSRDIVNSLEQFARFSYGRGGI